MYNSPYKPVPPPKPLGGNAPPYRVPPPFHIPGTPGRHERHFVDPQIPPSNGYPSMVAAAPTALPQEYDLRSEQYHTHSSKFPVERVVGVSERDKETLDESRFRNKAPAVGESPRYPGSNRNSWRGPPPLHPGEPVRAPVPAWTRETHHEHHAYWELSRVRPPGMNGVHAPPPLMYHPPNLPMRPYRQVFGPQPQQQTPPRPQERDPLVNPPPQTANGIDNPALEAENQVSEDSKDEGGFAPLKEDEEKTTSEKAKEFAGKKYSKLRGIISKLNPRREDPSSDMTGNTTPKRNSDAGHGYQTRILPATPGSREDLYSRPSHRSQPGSSTKEPVSLPGSLEEVELRRRAETSFNTSQESSEGAGFEARAKPQVPTSREKLVEQDQNPPPLPTQPPPKESHSEPMARRTLSDKKARPGGIYESPAGLRQEFVQFSKTSVAYSGARDVSSLSSTQSEEEEEAEPRRRETTNVRNQLEELEEIYSQVLRLLKGKESQRVKQLRRFGSVSSLPSSTTGPRYGMRERREAKPRRDVGKRFQRLESHIVTLARSVAQLSSEMRNQHAMIQEIEGLRREVAEIAAWRGITTRSAVAGANGGKNWSHYQCNGHLATNPNRVKKLTKFFGTEPPLLRQFLKKLGYEKYATAFENEKIGMMELPYLTEARLEKLGIPLGPRVRILQEAQSGFTTDKYNIYISVTLHTDCGDLKLELHCERCPKASENFLALCASGYYDGTIFHRNMKGFMIQGGDPTGTGKGGNSIWGGKFEDEIKEDLKHDARGVVSMANKGPDSNGSQFFITYAAQPHLDLKYTVFAKVIDGLETLDELEKLSVNPKNNKPLADTHITGVTIHANPLAG
ncbi:unnamed protein product [Notodromas monacha]|uniref:peptidylprolyl isomerase n=1 Tax=Notodromas monacha TaxID=399045 RepID=A0A7R9BF59_9CRUS|nr:unnamed protein product [Notodromas monacha]CAG0914176.1 unnamed protein product [Notodromas monacha]